MIETIDGGGGPPHDGEMEARIKKLEEFAGEAREKLRAIDGRLTKIDARLDRIDARLDTIEVRLDTIDVRLDTFPELFATKADLHREINAQTWRLVMFVCGSGTALVAATYFIAFHAK